MKTLTLCLCLFGLTAMAQKKSKTIAEEGAEWAKKNPNMVTYQDTAGNIFNNTSGTLLRLVSAPDTVRVKLLVTTNQDIHAHEIFGYSVRNNYWKVNYLDERKKPLKDVTVWMATQTPSPPQ